MPLLAKAKRKAPAKQRSQEHHTSFHNSHKNPVNIHGIYSFCYNFVPEGQQALDEQPSFGGVQRQIDLVFLPHHQHLPSFHLESFFSDFIYFPLFILASASFLAFSGMSHIPSIL